MKIERVNDNQIRCTLTREDLAQHQIKLSELAYGSEKAKTLFRDMMQQAAYECGFEAENIPLMIEAIPLSQDTIILIITKVEYPEELDTRFSQFSPDTAEDDVTDATGQDTDSFPEPVGADDILELFHKIQQAGQKGAKSQEKPAKPASKDSLDEAVEITVPVEITKLFVFHGLDEVSRLAHVLKGFYNGSNVLYKNADTKKYYLVISKSQHTPEDFNKVCNILSEYAKQEKYTSAVQAYFEEHYETIISSNALQVLAEL